MPGELRLGAAPAASDKVRDLSPKPPRELPLEVMYRIMEETDDPRIQLQAAIAAAPYAHAKLLPVKVKGDDKKPPSRFSVSSGPPRLVSSK